MNKKNKSEDASKEQRMAEMLVMINKLDRNNVEKLYCFCSGMLTGQNATARTGEK